MSLRRMLTRGMTGAVALTGALALAVPGVASADDTVPPAPQARPTVTSKVSGNTINIKIDPPAGVDCELVPAVLSPIDALPLVTGAAVDLSTLPTFGAPYKADGENSWTTGELGDGIYVVAGACQSADAVTSAYTFGFVPGSILGTIPQVFNLGSTVLTMPGGMDLIMQVIGSDMFGGDQSSGDGEGTTDPGTEQPGDGNAPGNPLDGLDMGSLAAIFGGGAPAPDAGAGGNAAPDAGAGGDTSAGVTE